MCPNCLGHCTKSEIEQPEADELWALFRAAHKQYQSEIVNGNKRYNRFVNDFVSYHFPFFSKNEILIRKHVMNINIVHELLSDRIDLVEKYFNTEVFGAEDFQKMYDEFNTVSNEPMFHSHIGLFSEEQIVMITDYVNQEKMFVTDVTPEQIKGFFECRLKSALIARSIPNVAVFLDKLHFNGLIVRRWAYIAVKYKMLMPQRTMRPCTHRSIITHLSEKRTSLESYNRIHNDFITKLKEKM